MWWPHSCFRIISPGSQNMNLSQRALQCVHIRHPWPLTSHRIRKKLSLYIDIIYSVCVLFWIDRYTFYFMVASLPASFVSQRIVPWSLRFHHLPPHPPPSPTPPPAPSRHTRFDPSGAAFSVPGGKGVGLGGQSWDGTLNDSQKRRTSRAAVSHFGAVMQIHWTCALIAPSRQDYSAATKSFSQSLPISFLSFFSARGTLSIPICPSARQWLRSTERRERDVGKVGGSKREGNEREREKERERERASKRWIIACFLAAIQARKLGGSAHAGQSR